MTKPEIEFENVKSKGNSEDSLLAIYILRILKKYSSPENPLSSQDVMSYLKEDYSIGCADDKSNAQQKKIRRHLDTLKEFYGTGCIGKFEGKTRVGHKWYYDAAKDEFWDEAKQVSETLSDIEIEFIVDMISSSKLLNAETTRAMVDKLLKKTNLSDFERERQLDAIDRENWTKSLNKELVLLKAKLQSYIYEAVSVSFDYEDIGTVFASPCEVLFRNGNFILDAKVGNEYHQFLLKKIRNLKKTNYAYDFDDDYFDILVDGDESDDTTLESLFFNISIIKDAMNKKIGIEFKYLSYAVDNDKVSLIGKDKRVFPHSLVFNNGKYYLIAFDSGVNSDKSRIDYYRVDLMSNLNSVQMSEIFSDWNKNVFDGIRRARIVEAHPLMMPGRESPVVFNVIESELGRVIDAFGKNARFEVTKEQRVVLKDLSIQKWNEDISKDECSKERIIKVSVVTTYEEAFRWALANADAVELMYPLDLRYRLRRIADPIKKTYVKSIDDKVRRNVDWICETGSFNLTPQIREDNIGEELAYESFKVLNDEGNNGIVNDISIWDLNADNANYLGSFKNTVWLEIKNSKSREPKWISELTELLGLSIMSTSIENVSWMKNMVKLQGVELQQSPITDLSVISEHKDIFQLIINEININDISFLEKYQKLQHLVLIGCPIKDYSPLLKILPLKHLEIDEKAVEALGMENIVKHHPDADIIVRQKITNRKD